MSGATREEIGVGVLGGERDGQQKRETGEG